jgi:hypothetical protein
MTRKIFRVGDTVILNRPINGKDKKFEYPRGASGRVIQVYQSSAVRVKFDNEFEPVVAANYLENHSGIN